MTGMDMKPGTLKALKESIAHWKRMKENWKIDERPNASYCALCARFDKYRDGILCEIDGEGCPVMEKTGQPACFGTPYEAAKNAHPRNKFEVTRLVILNWRRAAQAEIDFLESLLP